MRVHSGTQVAVFVERAKGHTMRLDAVRLQIDGRPKRNGTDARRFREAANLIS